LHEKIKRLEKPSGIPVIKRFTKPNKITGGNPDGKKTKAEYHEKGCR
jgi:hypothetical protein